MQSRMEQENDVDRLINDLQAAYLEYLNDYLTVERFAFEKCVSVEEASTVILAGRTIHAYRTEG